MPDETRQEIESLQRQVNALTAMIENSFNPDGTIKIQSLTIQPKDTSITAASGVVRVETNLGPIDILIA